MIFFLLTSVGLYIIQGTSNFILIGFAALVGMFSAQSVEKLKKIAESLLTTALQGGNTVPPQSSLPKKEPVTLALTSIEPKSGTIRGGTEVTITGKGFSDETIVSFGEKTASVKNLSPTSITVTTPDNVAGKVDVTINKDSQRFTERDAYEYIAG